MEKILLICIQFLLAVYNFENAYQDYKLIKADSLPSHKGNLIRYAIIAATLTCLLYLLDVTFWYLPILAFLSRQLFFDIPLNLLRHLPWDYLPLPAVNGAWLDKLEWRIVGKKYNWLLTLGYFIVYVILLIKIL